MALWRDSFVVSANDDSIGSGSEFIVLTLCGRFKFPEFPGDLTLRGGAVESRQAKIDGSLSSR